MIGGQHVIKALQLAQAEFRLRGKEAVASSPPIGFTEATVIRKSVPVARRRLIAGEHQVKQAKVCPLTMAQIAAVAVSVRRDAIESADPLDSTNVKKKAAAVFWLAMQSAAVTADGIAACDMVCALTPFHLSVRRKW